jgi:hypothetical protein
MHKLSDASVFYKYVATLDTLGAADRDILKKNADELFNRLKDYKIAVVTLGDMSIQDVAPIFERINSTGTQLTIVDLMRAATWSQDFDLIDAIDAVREALAAKNFGGVERKAILRTMSAAVGGGFSSGSIDGLRKLGAPILKKATSDAEEAYKRAVDFLATQIKIPSDAVVPYANQLVVLAEIFRKLPAPSSEQFSAIRKWFWRTSAVGYFSGWNTGTMAADQKAVERFANADTLDIEVAAGEPRPEVWTSRTFRTNNAHAKALAIILAYHRPMDLLSGQEVDVASALAWVNAKEFHHFFPRDYLQQRGEPGSKINALANIVMLTSSTNKTISNRAPSDYMKDVKKAAGAKLDSWLQSHLISAKAYEAALADDFDAFLRRRSEDIHTAITKLM